MKLLKEKKYRSKSNNNWSLIGFLNVLGYFLTSAAVPHCLAEVEIAEIDTAVLFQPPPKEEQPESTVGAASRQNGQCFQDFLAAQKQESTGDSHTMTAIVPDGNYGLTVTDHPTFWVYLPQTSAQQVILTIKEEGIKPHWQQSVSLTGEVGIIGIPLSDDAPALEIGKNYQWAVILVCGNRPNPNDPVVASWIKHVDESQVNSQLPAKTMLEKAAVYAQKGIWYDTLNILVEEKKSSVDNWHDIWVKYLQSGGLDAIANEPVLIP